MKRLIYLFLTFYLFLTYTSSQQLIWKHTGGPMGGIVGDIAINSLGEIYAGVYPLWNVYSGLYKSTDNGDSWNKIETQFDDFEVYAIYITKEDHIWVGTNFQGRIYRSTDNGITWENKRNGYDTGECWAFGQSKDSVLFAGDGQYVQLYRSTDYGENWELSANLRPFVFATDSNNIVYAGTHDGLFATNDNGITWAQNNFLSNIPVSTILIDSANNIYCGTGYYDNGNGVFYSTDSGQTWTQLGLAGKIVLSLAFDSQKNLLAGTKQDGLFKTTNIGQTWIQYNQGLYRKEVFRLKLNKQDDIFIGSENEGVFRSANNGESFNQIGLPTSNVKNTVFSGDSLIFTSTPSGVQKYNRATKEWINVGLQNVTAVSITPSNYLYVGTFDEGLYTSTDLGNTWILTNLTSDSLMSVYNVLAINDDTIFAATEFNLRYSYDGGMIWTVTPIRTDYFSRSLFFNNSLWVRGWDTNYRLYKSTDFGGSFNPVITGIGSLSESNSIYETNNGYIFLSDINFIRGLLRSTDNGQNWASVLFNNYCISVYAEDNGLVLTGYDTIYVSTDYGISWSSFYHTIGTQNYITDIKRESKGIFYFSSYRTGLYEVDIITSVNDDENNSIKSYQLFQNYPNPFNPITKIKFSIPNTDIVQIKVYNLLGKEITTLLNEYKQARTYEVEFDASNLPSGVYFYRIISGSFAETKKMLLLR